MASTIELVVVRNGDHPHGTARSPAGRELVFVVDGGSELDRWPGCGLDSDDLLNRDLPLLPPLDGTAVERAVRACECGDVDCDSLTCTIQRRRGVIEWSDARDRRRSVDIGPFSFDAGQYDEEVRRAHRETGLGVPCRAGGTSRRRSVPRPAQRPPSLVRRGRPARGVCRRRA